MVIFQFAMLVYQRVPPFLNGKKTSQHISTTQKTAGLATLLLRNRLGEEGRETACGLAKKAMRCGWIYVKQLVKQLVKGV